jgi:hypothetical protein
MQLHWLLQSMLLLLLQAGTLLPTVLGCQAFCNPCPHSLLSILIKLPPYSGRRTLSPSLTPVGMSSPACVRLPGPTASTTPSLTCARYAAGVRDTLVTQQGACRRSTSTLGRAESGSSTPPADLVGATTRSTKTRSRRGISLRAAIALLHRDEAGGRAVLRCMRQTAQHSWSETGHSVFAKCIQ